MIFTKFVLSRATPIIFNIINIGIADWSDDGYAIANALKMTIARQNQKHQRQHSFDEATCRQLADFIAVETSRRSLHFAR